jgi:hypothetical protein
MSVDHIELKRSPISGKKWEVKLFDKEGQKIKTVHFGEAGSSDFLQHKDKERRQRYIDRHGGARGINRENWTKSGIDTAGFWSRWLTWNKPTLSASIADIESKFNVNIKT